MERKAKEEKKIILSLQHVGKQFRRTRVLQEISFDVREGQVLGLVGRNGSGKTMILKAICGMIPVTEGKIFFHGRELGKEIEVPDHTGALIEEPGFVEDATGLWNLKFLASLTGKPDLGYLKELLQTVGLDPQNRLKVSKYSMGMKQRLGIAQAIMDQPELLLLDEPMNGLDNTGVQDMRILLQKLNQEGMTIIIASHIAEDISTLCDHVLYLDQGKIIHTEQLIGEEGL